MSAVFGVLRFDGRGVGGRELEAMRAVVAGHGGDGGGIWTADGVGLGQQLKAVTPEDLCELQPLVSRDGLRVLVSDGRVDNRPELSAVLGLAPAPAVPDSAFVLAAYERWGEDCARHLVGPLSFAVWDASLRRLLVARSPFGAKPVFFHQAAGFLAFAPMARALFAVPGVPRGLCWESLADCLVLVPLAPEASLFQGICSLEPGHVLTVDGRGGLRMRAFWTPEPACTLRLGCDQEYVEAFTERFDRAVADHLRSRGQVGVMMSAGLDSTSVAATAAPLLARRGRVLAAFTGAPRAGFGDPGAGNRLIDEAPLAGTMAARYGNIDLSVIRAGGLFLDGLERFFGAAESPFDAAANRVWYEAILSEAQRRDIRVMLTGKCGNWTVSWNGGGLIRSLIGSGRWAAAWRESVARTPGRRPPAVAAELLRTGLKARLPWPARLTIARLRNRDDPLLAADQWWAPVSPINPEFAREQHVAERTRARACDHWLRRGFNTPAARRLRLMDLQRDTGINAGYSALFGVDIRDPTADSRVAEFCLSLSEDQYRRGGVSRWLIRRAMAGRLPAEILASRRHGIQSADWFERLSGARARVFEELRVLEHSETARTVLDLSRMRRLADRMDQPPADPMEQRFDYALVLERGLMLGRFLRWFEDGGAG
jgi:asparagine synthase (glutamine-hydrolysing)